MEEAIVENNINVKSRFKCERNLLVDKIVEKMDFSQYNQSQAERKLRVVEKMVNMQFSNI